MAKIAIILGRLVIGGTTMDTLQVAGHLQRHHELLLITGGGEKDEFEAAYLTAHLPAIRHERINGFGSNIQPLRDLRAYFRLRKMLRRFKPELVHTHTAKAGLLGRMAAAAEKVPVIVHTYHGLMVHGYYHPVISRLIMVTERFLATKTTAVIALSAAQEQLIVQTCRLCPAQKVTVIPLGIELDPFQMKQTDKRNRFRQRYRLSDTETAVGIVGRIVPVKNHRFFLEVVKTLQATHRRLRFFIIGDGPLRKKLQQLCLQWKIDFTYYPEEPRRATLTFTSWITDMDTVMAGLDIVTLTSVSEGTPVSLMEAQAAGKPVVALLAGGIEDVVKQEITGFLLPQNDRDGFVKKLALLGSREETCRKMGQAGMHYANQHFAKNRQTQQLNDFYTRLLSDVKH